MTQVTLHFDGATHGGNPGLGGAAAVISINNDPDLQVRVHNRMGLVGSNCAEYYGLVLGLRELLHLFPASPYELTIRGDSELVIKQMSGEWQVRDDIVRSYHLVADGLLGRVKKRMQTTGGVTTDMFDGRDCQLILQHIPREQNATADGLAKRAANMNVHPNLRFFHTAALNWFMDGTLQGTGR